MSKTEAPIIFVRIALVLTFVPGLVWVAVSRLVSEISGVPKYVWWECCDFVEASGRLWRTGEFPGEDEL